MKKIRINNGYDGIAAFYGFVLGKNRAIWATGVTSPITLTKDNVFDYIVFWGGQFVDGRVTNASIGYQDVEITFVATSDAKAFGPVAGDAIRSTGRSTQGTCLLGYSIHQRRLSKSLFYA